MTTCGRAAKGTAQRDAKDHRERQRDGQQSNDHRDEHAVPDAPVGTSDACSPEDLPTARDRRSTIPAVMNVTVAEDAAPTTHASAVPPLSRQEHPESRRWPPVRARARTRRCVRRRDASRARSRAGRRAREGSRPGACRRRTQARSRRLRLPPPAGAATRSAPRRSRSPPTGSRYARRPRAARRVKAIPARAAPAKASIERGASAGPVRLSTSTYTSVTQAASSTAAASRAATRSGQAFERIGGLPVLARGGRRRSARRSLGGTRPSMRRRRGPGGRMGRARYPWGR